MNEYSDPKDFPGAESAGMRAGPLSVEDVADEVLDKMLPALRFIIDRVAEIEAGVMFCRLATMAAIKVRPDSDEIHGFICETMKAEMATPRKTFSERIVDGDFESP